MFTGKSHVIQKEKPSIVYYPWSRRVLEDCINDWVEKKLPTIDLELTAKCTQCSCIYCDSKPRVGRFDSRELTSVETIKLMKEAKKLGLKWLYVCGLGEPTEDTKLFELIEYSSDAGIDTSIFTNATLIDEEMAKFFHTHSVSLVVKLDTFDEQVFDKILGKRGMAKRIYQAMEHLLNAGYAQRNKNNTTDLAFSIVPTKLSLSAIPNVVRIAKKHNIFPSIGELEFSGNANIPKVYRELALSPEQTQYLKHAVDEILWPNYKRPICPAVLTGLHIDYIGNVVADQNTGLACKWFMLKEPTVHTIGDVRTDNLATLLEEVKDYQCTCFENPEKIKNCQVDYTFGGCGGNPKEILGIAKRIVASYRKKPVFT